MRCEQVQQSVGLSLTAALLSVVGICCGGGTSIAHADADARTDLPDEDTDAAGASDVPAAEAAETGGILPTDAAVATDLVSDGRSWSPEAVPGLVLWLDASVGVSASGGHVDLWRDGSGQANHARQEDPTRMPSLVSDGIGGMPSVAFQPADTGNDLDQWLTVADSASIRFGTDDFTILVVAKFVHADLQVLLHKSEADEPFTGAALYVGDPDGTLSTYLGNDSTGAGQGLRSAITHLENSAHLFGLRRVGTTVELRVDEKAEDSQAFAERLNFDAVGSHLYIGEHGEKRLFPLAGLISAVAAVKGAISSSDLEALEHHLMVRYAIAP